MPRLCRAPGCDSPTTSRYSVYCARHQSRLRRQGDVAQKAISKAELKTYLKRVRQRIAKNPDSPAWGQLEARWLAVVEHAKGVVAEFQFGQAGIRYVRKAAAGAHATAHQHPQEQFVWLIKGAIRLRIGAEERAIRPGDIAVIPGGIEHEAFFPEDTEVIGFFAPVREDFLTGEVPPYMAQR
jgi:quercetin dioxygenase-like cupin family protein